jgi:phage terminase large subunit-like protein
VVKASSYIEVPLRDGIVYVNSRIPKNILNEFWSVMKGFPLASHDDDVDALVVMVAGCLEYSGLKFGGLL